MSVGWNRRWTATAAVLSFGLIAMCAWFSWNIAFEGFGDLGDFKRGLIAVMFALFGLLFIGVAVTYALASFDGAPVLVIGPEGVDDRRISRTPVPFASIKAVSPLQKGAQLMLMLQVDEPWRQPMPANPVWRVNRLAGRLLGNPELVIRVTGLRTSLPEVLAALQSEAQLAADATADVR